VSGGNRIGGAASGRAARGEIQDSTMARAFEARERARRAIAERRPDESLHSARAAGLIYVSDEDPGITRRRAGRGFDYRTPTGRRPAVRTLQRIRALAIPPAYTQVWICVHERGHLQATGRDARRRKQYRYHPRWRLARDEGKFGRMPAFGAALPALRRKVRRDLALPGLPRDKVLAIVIALLARSLVRVGNDEYARSNRSFGLTTLRDRHVSSGPQGLQFEFRGKSGQRQSIAIGDPHLTRLVRRCQALPGQVLFQYLDEDGQVQPIDSGMVNDYLRDTMGEAFSAKDFRTWGGTLAALAAFARTPLPARGGEAALKSTQLAVVREVAALLGNTPAVCRASYIHPAVFDAWREGRLQRSFARSAPRTPSQYERWALRMLRPARRGKTAA
jgi:DNA topoisomerase-1